MQMSDLTKEQLEICCDLLLRAYKNKDRQLNYWNLYNMFEKNEITEEQFEKEIDDNEDKYVWSSNKEVTKEELFLAVQLVDEMGGDAEDMYDCLFDFSNSSINKIMKELSNDQSNENFE